MIVRAIDHMTFHVYHTFHVVQLRWFSWFSSGRIVTWWHISLSQWLVPLGSCVTWTIFCSFQFFFGIGVWRNIRSGCQEHDMRIYRRYSADARVRRHVGKSFQRIRQTYRQRTSGACWRLSRHSRYVAISRLKFRKWVIWSGRKKSNS